MATTVKSVERWVVTVFRSYLLASFLQTLGLLVVSVWAIGTAESFQYAMSNPIDTVQLFGMYFIEPVPIYDVVTDWWVWTSYLVCFGAVAVARHRTLRESIQTTLGGDD